MGMATTGRLAALEPGQRVAVRLVSLPKHKAGRRLAAVLFAPLAGGAAEPRVGTSGVIQLTPDSAANIRRLHRFVNVVTRENVGRRTAPIRISQSRRFFPHK